MSVSATSGAPGGASTATSSGPDEREDWDVFEGADNVLDLMVFACSLAGTCSEITMRSGLTTQAEAKLRIGQVIEQMKDQRAKAAQLRQEVADLKASAEADDPNVGDKILRFFGCQEDQGAVDSANANKKSAELQQVQAMLDELKSTMEHAGNKTLRIGDDVKQSLDDILAYLDSVIATIDEHLASFERLNS